LELGHNDGVEIAQRTQPMPPQDKPKSNPPGRTDASPQPSQGSSEENSDIELEKQGQKERDYVAKTSRRGYV